MKPNGLQPLLFRTLESLLRGSLRLAATPARWWQRLRKKPAPVANDGLLPTLIKVFAAFANMDGVLLEEEIDSCLGFLRYDYPEAVYSEIRRLFRQALHEQQDLNAIARQLASELSEERKLLLGVQLYDLIARAGASQQQIVAYYSFMTHLGMATQAVDIVYQLNADSADTAPITSPGASPLEVLTLGHPEEADVPLCGFPKGQLLLAYRYHDLILLRNRSTREFLIQGRALQPGRLARIYSHERLFCGDHVITHADLVFFFNAKKGISKAHVFVSLNSDDQVRIHPQPTRDACLEVLFGLRVQITALQPVEASLHGQPLRPGHPFTATLHDSVFFHNRGELSLDELWRQARAYGRRFALRPSKSQYLVSNQPSLLEEGDILLTPGTGGDLLLKIECDYDQKTGRLTILQADRPIVVRGTPVRNACTLQDGDIIQIAPGQWLRCNFTDRVIEEERNVIRTLEIRDLTCRFKDGETALESLSFSARRGEMICIMGASGSGKSSLLRALAGQFRPHQGEVLLNGLSLYHHYDDLKQYIAHVPQFDAFDEHLTIEENLRFAAELRSPHLSRRERQRRIDQRLAELGLHERRRSIVGPPHKKLLSGGERKRLNIGLDMFGSADVYLFDEPTSGLSSKDSEHVIEIIRGLSQNKITLITLHQPSSKIFSLFHKILLLDKGGKLVFFGTPEEALRYFAEAEHEQQFGTPLGACPACGATRPEFIFDVLETPLRDLSGDIIYEQNNRGQLVPARRFTPDYWRDRYEAWRLAKEVRSGTAIPREQPPAAPPRPPATPRPSTWNWNRELSQLRTLITRAFLSKLRNETNLLITLIMAPLLALLIGLVLRYSESARYDFASAFHIPAYLFLSVVVAMFLGLTNSVDDIIHDRPLLLRERNLNIRIPYYITAKLLSLGLFAAIQCLLFTLIGNWLLAVRGYTWPMFGFLFLTALSGIAIGLVLSSLVSESKTAILLIPAVFIPQIILGGSFIKYEEMNRDLDLAYVFQSWFHRHPATAQPPRSDLTVPLISEFNPMRWAYEAIVFGQARLNPLTSRQRRIQAAIRSLIAKPTLTPQEEARLDDLKELLAIISGLSAPTPNAVDASLRAADRVLDGAPLDRQTLLATSGPITAEQLYINQKVMDLIARAEMEQADYRETRHINVFFGPVKHYFGIRAGILTFNSAVLLLSSALLFSLLHLILHRQLHSSKT